MTTKKPSSRTYHNVLQHQANLADDIDEGLCTASCVAARDRYADCDCRCDGRNHGALWEAHHVELRAVPA